MPWNSHSLLTTTNHGSATDPTGSRTTMHHHNPTIVTFHNTSTIPELLFIGPLLGTVEFTVGSHSKKIYPLAQENTRRILVPRCFKDHRTNIMGELTLAFPVCENSIITISELRSLVEENLGNTSEYDKPTHIKVKSMGIKVKGAGDSGFECDYRTEFDDWLSGGVDTGIFGPILSGGSDAVANDPFDSILSRK